MGKIVWCELDFSDGARSVTAYMISTCSLYKKNQRGMSVITLFHYEHVKIKSTFYIQDVSH